MTGRGTPAKNSSPYRAEPPGLRAYFSINIVPLRVTDFLIRTLILVVMRQFLASHTLSFLASSLSLLAPPLCLLLIPRSNGTDRRLVSGMMIATPKIERAPRKIRSRADLPYSRAAHPPSDAAVGAKSRVSRVSSLDRAFLIILMS